MNEVKEERSDLCFTAIDGPLVSLHTDFVTAVYLCMAASSSIAPQATAFSARPTGGNGDK